MLHVLVVICADRPVITHRPLGQLVHRALFSMHEAITETVAAVSIEDGLTNLFAVHFPPPASGGFVFGEGEYSATFLY